MKKISAFIIALVMVVAAMAQPPKGQAKKGTTYGAKITAAGAIDANVMKAMLLVKDKPVEDVKIKGKVVEVCKEMGCWLRMETINGPMLIKMKGHSFFVPLDINGKTVVVDGVASLKEISVEELKDQAQDAKKSKEVVDAIKEPKTEIVVEANGILVM